MSTMLSEKEKFLTLSAAAQTDTGRTRPINEDTVFARTEKGPSGEDRGLYIVCDGLGGHRAGEVASQLAVETVSAELSALVSEKISVTAKDELMLDEALEAAVSQANNVVRRFGEAHPHEAGDLSTTLTLALIYDEMLYVASVGDSRAYIWRDDQVIQVTKDHTLLAKLAEVGIIDQDQSVNYANRNMLYRVLGADPTVSVDLFRWKLVAGDRLLLCSDGLWQAFPDTSDLGWWISRAATPKILCRRLIEEANRRDGSDNISAIVVSVDTEDRQAVAADEVVRQRLARL